MSRPVEFDHDLVLNNALAQFRRDGFEASSIQKLLDVTQINRGTLYNSFGDKGVFFKLCLAQYNLILQEVINQTLANEKLNSVDAINRFFEHLFVDVTSKERVLGCLLVNTICESTNWDKTISKIARKSLGEIRKALLKRTRSLHADKKLQKGLSAELAADCLMTTLKGLRVDAREGNSTKQILETSRFSVKALLRKS